MTPIDAYLHTWSLVGGTVWEGPVDVALSEEMLHWGMGL